MEGRRDRFPSPADSAFRPVAFRRGRRRKDAFDASGLSRFDPAGRRFDGAVSFANLSLLALEKLGLSPAAALAAAVGIILGGAVNIPVHRIPREEEVVLDPFSMFGAGRLFYRRARTVTHSVLAVNLGGCVIPTLLAVYELAQLWAADPWTVPRTTLAALVNIAVCYRLARPLAGVGIAMPAFIPPLTAATAGLLLVPEAAPNAAFIAGVLGPLIGADLLHLKDIKKISVGYASIGGAGTFDGIVLSGLLAAFLA